MAVLENGSHFHGERLAAGVALVKPDAGGFTLHLADAILALAMRADRAFRPYASLHPRIGGGFGVKVLLIEDGHGVSPYRINISYLFGYVKYNMLCLSNRGWRLEVRG